MSSYFRKVTKICIICGKEYLVKPSGEKRSKYCSKKCWSKRKISQETREKIRSRLKGKRNSPQTEFKKGNIPKRTNYPKGELHPNWQGKIPLKIRMRKWKEYKKWKKAVFERDNYTCQNCSISDKRKNPIILDAHHILSVVKHPELMFDINNGKTLCLNCHALTSNFRNKAKLC